MDEKQREALRREVLKIYRLTRFLLDGTSRITCEACLPWLQAHAEAQLDRAFLRGHVRDGHVRGDVRDERKNVPGTEETPSPTPPPSSSPSPSPPPEGAVEVIMGSYVPSDLWREIMEYSSHYSLGLRRKGPQGWDWDENALRQLPDALLVDWAERIRAGGD